ncbi:MAG: hypothetical protein IT357_07525 [Gemmatimonadaceae bacterium]|nr:hypothetical protein [Gemmatimonadaceae bacterium]
MRPVVLCLLIALAACGGESPSPVEPPRNLEPVNLQWADVGQACGATAPAVPLSDAARDSLGPPPASFPGSDTYLASVARRVPGGWGGNFRANGVFTVYLVDTTQLAAVRTALAPEGYTVPADAVAKQGRWNFAQLHDWFQHLIVGIAGRGVTFLDIQEAENRIEIYVESESRRAGLEAHLRSRGAVCNLVAIGVQRPITLF